MELRDDPRWRRLLDQPRSCPSCGGTHLGIFDIAYSGPFVWDGPEEYSPNSAVTTSTHFLSDDFCVTRDEHFFVRCVLELPIRGAGGERFGFGVWSSLARHSFKLYVESFDDQARGELGPWFGWFSNRLNGYENTLHLKCMVHPRAERQRPLIEIEPTDHLLSREQREGITLDRLLELYAAHGHDLRAALTD